MYYITKKKISDFIKGGGEKGPFCLVEQYVKIINLSFQQDCVKFEGRLRTEYVSNIKPYDVTRYFGFFFRTDEN